MIKKDMSKTYREYLRSMNRDELFNELSDILSKPLASDFFDCFIAFAERINNTSDILSSSEIRPAQQLQAKKDE